MKRSMLLAFSAIALPLAACQETAEPEADEAVAEATPAMPDDAMAGGATAGTDAMAGAMTPVQFVADAAMSDMFEIRSSELAAEKAQSPQVREFARMMVEAHRGTTAELMEIAQAANITPPAQMDAAMQQRISALEAASDEAFDELYVDEQVRQHQMTLQKLQAYAANGDNGDLRAFAAKTVRPVSEHLRMARDLDSGSL